MIKWVVGERGWKEGAKRKEREITDQGTEHRLCKDLRKAGGVSLYSEIACRWRTIRMKGFVSLGHLSVSLTHSALFSEIQFIFVIEA